MNALPPATPAKAIELVNNAAAVAQLEADLELTLRALKKRIGFTGTMRAIDKTIRKITRAQGDVGDGWVG